jgi:hypothetical protein
LSKEKKLKYYQKFIFHFILPLFVEATVSPFMKTPFVSEHENIILMYDFDSLLLPFKSPSISVRKLSEVILTKLTKNEKQNSGNVGSNEPIFHSIPLHVYSRNN